ncbi:hypothetical protein D3C72_320080 [compost metagenome]
MIHVDIQFVSRLMRQYGIVYQVRFSTRGEAYPLVEPLYNWLMEPGRDVFMGTTIYDPQAKTYEMTLPEFYKRSVFYMISRADVLTCKLIHAEVLDLIRFSTDQSAESVQRMAWQTV